MSRSRKKTPIVAITTDETNAPFKHEMHKKRRLAEKQALDIAILAANEDVLEGVVIPPDQVYTDDRDSNKDGKQYIFVDSKEKERLLRK